MGLSKLEEARQTIAKGPWKQYPALYPPFNAIVDHLDAAEESGELARLKKLILRTWACAESEGLAMSGDMEFAIVGSALAENITAAELNAAAVGTLTRVFAVRLQTSMEQIHIWCSLPLVIVPAEAAVDADIGPPTVPAGLALDEGCLPIPVTFDTDAGATKIYAAGDALTVPVQVAADDKLLGHTVALITKTYNVV